MIETILTAVAIVTLLVGPVAFWAVKAMKRSKALTNEIAASEAEDARKEAERVLADDIERSMQDAINPLDPLWAQRGLFATDNLGRIITLPNVGPMNPWTIKTPTR